MTMEARMTSTLRMVIALLPLLAAAPGAAQVPLLEKGAELARLEVFAGAWEGRLERVMAGGAGLVLEPRLRFEWAIGGVWLMGHEETELADGSLIHNLTWITWDAHDRVYAGAWHDNVFAGVVTFRGRWLDDRRLELDSGPIEIRGRRHRVILTYALAPADELTVEMRQSWDGAEPRVVATAHYRRRR